MHATHSLMVGSDVSFGIIEAISKALSLCPTDLELSDTLAFEKPGNKRYRGGEVVVGG